MSLQRGEYSTMELSERQKDILQKTVFEYIGRAEPISSLWLEERYGMPFSPATIRNELVSLTEQGYLEQPYTSAGRMPTDRGYRFFVDELQAIEQEFPREEISEFSALAIAYHRRTLWKEGWEHVLQEPEFSRGEMLGNFTRFLSDVEKNINQIRRVKRLEVYIGRENPFSRIGDFSMIVSACDFGFVAIVGPKRMPYQKNIGFIHSLANVWKKKLKR